MAKEYSLGVMVGNMKDNIKMIKRKGLANSFGQMEGHTMDIGKMENKMASEYIQVLNIVKKQENGSMVKELSGLQTILWKKWKNA